MRHAFAAKVANVVASVHEVHATLNHQHLATTRVYGVMSYAVWRSFRFALSYRDGEELLAERGVIVTYETIRQWGQTFGQQYANQLRRRAQTGDKWH